MRTDVWLGTDAVGVEVTPSIELGRTRFYLGAFSVSVPTSLFLRLLELGADAFGMRLEAPARNRRKVPAAP